MIASGSLAGTTALRPETTPRPVLQGRKSPPPPPLLNEADWMAAWLRASRARGRSARAAGRGSSDY